MLAVLAEDLISAPSTHIRQPTNACSVLLQGNPMPSSGLFGSFMHMVHIHTCRQNTHTHKIKIKTKKRRRRRRGRRRRRKEEEEEEEEGEEESRENSHSPFISAYFLFSRILI